MDALVHGDFGLGEAGGDCLCDGGLGDGSTLVQIAGMGHTYTVSPTLLIDGTFGWTRFGQDVEPPDLGSNFGLDVLGIPGTNGPDPRESGMPPMYMSGYSALGNPEGWNPLYRNDQSYTFNTNASWIKGQHDLRFGFDFVHHLMNHWQPELGEGPRGAFHFDPGVTALNPEALDTAGGFLGDTPSFENDWNSLAGFLLGTPTASGKSSQFIKMNSFENQYALYFRDRWRATQKLTLDLGLRWELYPNRTRSGGLGIESYDPATNEALIGGRGGIPQDNGVGFSKKLFAPRVGFAYQVSDSTVIRSGYGITYHSHPWGAQALRGWFPLTVVASFSGVNGFQPVTTGAGYVEAGVPNAPLGPTVGIPSICCPDISTGRVPLPSVAETGYPVANQELHRGYIQSWNLVVERQLPAQFIASLGYIGSASVRGFAFLDINASQIPGSGDEGRPLFAPFGRTTTTREWDGRTHSIYHSLQATANRRFTHGLLLKAAYTYSRAIDSASYSDWTEYSWNASSVFDRNRAAATHNIPHNFQLGFVYELPFGADKTWATSGTSAAILGGWQMNGLFSAYQGRQFTLTASDASLNMPGNLQTPDQIKDHGRTVRQCRRRRDVFRHQRVCASDRGAVRQRRQKHDARAGRGELGPEPVPHVQAHRAVPAAVPGGGVQREQHAALRQPERQRQQLELREGSRHGLRVCYRAVAGVQVRVTPDVLVLGFSTSPPGAASNACAPLFCVEAYGGWFAGGIHARRPELQFRRGTYHGPLTSPLHTKVWATIPCPPRRWSICPAVAAGIPATLRFREKWRIALAEWTSRTSEFLDILRSIVLVESAT